ncbi:MAG TPA: hypothetical protein VGY98_00600 [Verrucomicrobiae bacterium]|nr:hypothetical protein [Verrucomicrobiae bacterium]
MLSIEKKAFYLFTELDTIGAAFKNFRSLPQIKTNALGKKVMTTTDIKGVPGCWKELWNAMLNVFRRNKTRVCSAEHQPPALQVEEPGRAAT